MKKKEKGLAKFAIAENSTNLQSSSEELQSLVSRKENLSFSQVLMYVVTFSGFHSRKAPGKMDLGREMNL